MEQTRFKPNLGINFYLIKFRWWFYSALAISYLFLLFFARDRLAEPLGGMVLITLLVNVLVVFRHFKVKEDLRLSTREMITQTEQRFSSLVSNSFDIVLVFDEAGTIRFQSPSVRRVLGYTDGELLGKRGLDYVHREDISKIIRVARLIANDPTAEIMRESRFRHKDGSWRILEGIGTSFVDRTSGINGFILNSRDITHHKIIEKNLRAFARKLQMSNRELEDFASVASHDLQEPLRKVRAFGERLKQNYGDRLTGEGVDYLDRMLDASRRMQNLINDLLAFSRLTTKARPFSKVDLNNILTEILSDFEIKVEETKARIEIGDLPTVEADRMQMGQLFQNLFANALKFHPKGNRPEIRIYAETNPATDLDDLPGETDPGSEILEKGFCRIYTQDNGIGFDEKYLERIFGVFQRLHGRTEFKGSGVGLAVCRKIVERHNGHITARSVPGQGTTFVVTLPLSQPSEEG